MTQLPQMQNTNCQQTAAQQQQFFKMAEPVANSVQDLRISQAVAEAKPPENDYNSIMPEEVKDRFAVLKTYTSAKKEHTQKLEDDVVPVAEVIAAKDYNINMPGDAKQRLASLKNI